MQQIIIVDEPVMADLLEAVISLTYPGKYSIIKTTSYHDVFEWLSLTTYDQVHSILLGFSFQENRAFVDMLRLWDMRDDYKLVVMNEKHHAREQCSWLHANGWFTKWRCLDTETLCAVLTRLDRVVQLV